MITAEQFLSAAKDGGFDFYTGVPCSFLTPLIDRVISDGETRYIGAASEGEAVAIAAGAWLAGRETVVMLQNSGLGNTVNPLTSLNFPFRIPTLLIVTWRAGPGIDDEPQHELMGEITPALLDTIRVAHQSFPQCAEQIEPALRNASSAMHESGLPFAFILQKGMVRSDQLSEADPRRPPRGEVRDLRSSGQAPSRYAALERLVAVLPQDAAVIATTGKCGRELFTISDRAQHLYQVGSMGCASGMGLGVALNVSRPVVVLDGDGAALMKLGTLATIGAEAPPNLVHVLLDNGVHDSTGAQPTVSPGVDFAALAIACGYRQAYACSALPALERAVRESLTTPGPHFVHMRIVPGSIEALGRPSIGPAEVAQRFKSFLAHKLPLP